MTQKDGVPILTAETTCGLIIMQKILTEVQRKPNKKARFNFSDV